MCFDCINIWKISETNIFKSDCGIQSFNNNDIFCKWLLKQINYKGFAHNLKAYDGIFIMKYIVNNQLPTDGLPKITKLGAKFMSIEFENQSIHTIPMPLKIPKNVWI